MSGRDPWEGSGEVRLEPGPAGGLFSRPNLPYTLATVVALSALTAFVLVANPFDDDTVGAPPTTAPIATTTSSIPVTTTLADVTTTSGVDLGGPFQGLQLELLADGLAQPVGAWSPPGDDRVFVLERGGRVRIVDDQGLQATPYLDLVDRVGSGGIENGLLGLAFHPEFAANGRLFVYYTDLDEASPNSRISEFRASSGSAPTADRSTERIILEIPQEGLRHRAGMLQFGPDGHLWIAVGDGGTGDRSAQDLESHHGSLLRIDVDSADPYAIPTDNPFATGGALPEIWAYGLRNPWRFFIDDVDGLVYIGDVGQESVEELDVVGRGEGGLDFGWPDFEGENCYHAEDCNQTGWERPVVTYGHESGACSVTGGIVYRGDAIPELVGHYFYADWCLGFIKSFRYSEGAVTEERDWSGYFTDLGTLQISSFGWDGAGELLVVDSNGAVYRLVALR